jgi:hypothetical protein
MEGSSLSSTLFSMLIAVCLMSSTASCIIQ